MGRRRLGRRVRLVGISRVAFGPRPAGYRVPVACGLWPERRGRRVWAIPGYFRCPTVERAILSIDMERTSIPFLKPYDAKSV